MPHVTENDGRRDDGTQEPISDKLTAELQAIANADQSEASTLALSRLTNSYFDELRGGSFTRSEAFKLTQTYVLGLMRAAGSQRKGGD